MSSPTLTDAPKPVQLFTIPKASDSDISQLDSNYGNVTNSIPSDIQTGLTSSGHQLSGKQTVDILAAKSKKP